MTDLPPVCDYEGSDYRARFWQGQGREYEDQTERLALQRLLPRRGATLLDIGAGFGRLADEFSGYQTVVLLDYATSLLREAQTRLGHDPRFLFVAANWYQMPFVNAVFETLVQVRTLHHAADAPALWRELARIARPQGHYILEFANKRHLKAITRHALGQQAWSPYDPAPVEFVPLNYDFHPAWVQQQLQTAGFQPYRRLALSFFRLEGLKRRVPAARLAQLDYYLQPLGRWLSLTPSLFIASHHPANQPPAPAHQLLACPICRMPLARDEMGPLVCAGCGRAWGVEQGLYNFKEPLEG